MALPEYDVLIVGSGASGGMAAYTLTKMGVKCLLLEAGPLVDFEKQRVLKPVYELPYRGLGKPGKLPHVFQANEFNANQWVDEQEVPYTHDPSAPYNWVRARMVGGKSLFWARMSFRLSDFEFKAKDHDGYGENWPISHADLDPYYRKAEKIFRVSGRKEGWAQLPDGDFIEDDSTDSESVNRFKASATKMGVPVTKMRRSLGQGPFASSFNLLLPDAMATGNLTIVPNAVAREVTLDKATGKANGVSYVDRQSKREYFAKARVVILGASCLESTRLLLNSGIANSSGALGHYLMDQFYITQVVMAAVPEAKDGKGTRRLMGGGGYIPRFRNIKSKEKDFIRGYALDFSSGGSPDIKYFPGYGEAQQKEMERYRGTGFSGTAMGDVLPRYENHVRINKQVKDAYGIPVLHFDAKYGDNEVKMAKDAINTMEELCKGAGFEILARNDKYYPPGYSIHELGTARMSDDPKKGVLNKYNQSHDVKNLFVVDGSSFVTAGPQNPTMTILALSARASEYAAELMKKKEL